MTSAIRSARPGTPARRSPSDGSCMVVEPFAGDRIEDNLNPVGRMYYGFSTLLLHPGIALATRPRRRSAPRPGSPACAR